MRIIGLTPQIFNNRIKEQNYINLWYYSLNFILLRLYQNYVEKCELFSFVSCIMTSFSRTSAIILKDNKSVFLCKYCHRFLVVVSKESASSQYNSLSFQNNDRNFYEILLVSTVFLLFVRLVVLILEATKWED